jgi:predicted site-specific integrase-resolvase
MLLEKSWFTLKEAESKFGVNINLILEWVNEGIVRAEMEREKVVRVNADDLELKLGERLLKL